ncbi:hypothetical protein RP20_CCG002077 [Aedes albopictus]|nr:hypothetical protein RP20_CCG002077 [Aedes albopictus]
MLRIAVLLLASFSYGALASSSIVDFQEQFSEHSHGVEFELQEYRAKNSHVRSEVIHRILDGVGNLTVEMRDITADYWAQIEAHQYATPECLERLRPDFDYYVRFASLDIRAMAAEMDALMMDDARYRFNPVASYAQQENSRAIYQTVQTLGRNQFLDNMDDTVHELQDELEYHREVWNTFQGMLSDHLDGIVYLTELVEERIEYWYDFTVSWHHTFMGHLLKRPGNECRPEEVGGRVVGSLALIEALSAKMKVMRERVVAKIQ